jgi:DNA-binding LacI/PurR family transcriptional regulator
VSAPESRDHEAGRRRAGVREVAQLAGVSRQTVSRVVNGHPSIRDSTRRRVEDAMRELDFRPNLAARSLSTRRSGTLGILAAAGSSLFGPASSVDAIETAARDAGYSVTIAHAPQPTASGVTAAVEQLVSQSVEGIVVLAPWRHAARALDGLHLSIPTVTLHGAATTDGADEVAVDQDAGARAVARHLAQLGHRRIAHLAGPDDWTEAVVRRDAFVDELGRLGISAIVTAPAGWSADDGYRAATTLLADAAITAVFTANDQQAIGVLHAAAELGRPVPGGPDAPGGLSVVGFDDIPEAAHLTPPLTTVRQDFAALGRGAVARLIARIAGADAGAGPEAGAGTGTEAEAEAEALPPFEARLVIRKSTAAPFSPR